MRFIVVDIKILSDVVDNEISKNAKLKHTENKSN